LEILVLGGTGFLGRYIVEELIKANHSVTILTRNPAKLNVFCNKIPYIVGDLLNYKEINFSNYTHIINCSGELSNEELMQNLHVDCIKGILQQIKHTNADVHWLQISSVGVYGKVRDGVVSEDSLFAPVGPYEITKAEGERLLKEFCLENKINYTIIRPSNVFGIGMPNQSLAQLVSMLRKRLFFYIGNAQKNAVMNYVPAEDVARLVALCICNPQAKNQEYIISDQIPLNHFVQIVCEEMNVKSNFYCIPERVIRLLAVIPGLPLTQARVDALTMQVKYSTEKARKELQFCSESGLALKLKSYVASITNTNAV
jgi:nucleoside-diphosphate-sugar epimerase